MSGSWEDIFGVGREINRIKHSQIALIVSRKKQVGALLCLIFIRSVFFMAGQLCKVFLLVRLRERNQYGFGFFFTRVLYAWKT